MRLAVIVTEFPKTTETFILRDLVEFHGRGHEVRIYHMTSFRDGEIVHGFARETLDWTRPQPYLFGWSVLRAALKALFTRPLALLRMLTTLAGEYSGEPAWLAKSLLIFPKCLAFAEDMRRWPADHIHAEFATHPATCAWMAGRLTGIPYSVSCRAHDIFLTQAMLGPKLSEASFVRTISEFNRRFLTERVPSLDGAPIEVIHSSVPVEDIPAEPAGGEGAYRIQYMGSLEKRKGIDTLLRSLAEAEKELGEWRCRIAGGGPERSALERLCEELGISDRVEFQGPLPFEEITGAYQWAHVVVVPSIVGPGGRTEGIPNVIMEALAHLRPVIGTRVSGIPELVETGVTGLLVRPGDHEELASALVWMKLHPEEAGRMAAEGRERVKRDFNLPVNAQRQLDLFERHRAGARSRSRGPAAVAHQHQKNEAGS